MIVHFDSKYLPVLSMDEAILYGHIEFLSMVNKVSGLNFFDDYYWVDANYSNFSGLFTFWSVVKVRELFERMVSIGVIEQKTFNSSRYCIVDGDRMNDLLSGKVIADEVVLADDGDDELTWKGYQKKMGINYKSVPNRRDVAEYLAVIDGYNQLFSKNISLTNTNYRLISQAFANGHSPKAIIQAFQNRPKIEWTTKYWKPADFPSMFYQKNGKGDPVDWVDTFAGENFSSNKQDLQKELQEVINWFKILHDITDSDRVKYFATVKYPVWSVSELKGCSGDYDLITESLNKLYNAYRKYINLVDT